MKSTSTVFITAGAIAVSVFAIVAYAHQGSTSVSKPTPESRIEHGRYIVNQLGLCIDCHSPRNEKGEHLPDQHLTGAPLPFVPTVPMPWMGAAPRIAGLPDGYTPEHMVHFLMTGERPNGLPPPLPPMPPYRMSREDAEATVAYLRTLPTGAH